jgi:putative DNA primase/helicase
VNHYQELGVRSTASLEEIKKAYRALSREWNPDVNPNPGAAERFRAINEAYEVLSNVKKREKYDKKLADELLSAAGLDKAAEDFETSVSPSGSVGSVGSGPLLFPPDLEYPAPGAPFDVVQRLYKDHALGKEINHLWAHQGNWMAWHTTCWAEIDEAELRQVLYRVLATKWYWHSLSTHDEPRWWTPTKNKVGNVLDALRAAVHLSSKIDAPSWTEPPPGIDPPPWTPYGANLSDAAQTISCRNGLLDLGSRTLAEHTPALYNLVAVPFDYDPAAPEPLVWLNFLKELWSDDKDSIMLLQQWFGYVLSGRLEQQKLLLLLGPIRSGKGTLAGVLKQLLGDGNIAHPTTASLSTNFGLSPLVGKPLAIIADARLGNTSASSPIVERILNITGEDGQNIDRKYKAHFIGKLPTRLMLLSNELPQFKDASGAIANRFMILKMTRSWADNPDLELADKLRPELPGILNWSLAGLDDLVSRGKFIIPQSSIDSMTLIKDLASPTSAFVREMCTVAPSMWCAKKVLYAAYKLWCDDNGHNALQVNVFGRDLYAVLPQLERGERTINGVRTNVHIGIGPRGTK